MHKVVLSIIVQCCAQDFKIYAPLAIRAWQEFTGRSSPDPGQTTSEADRKGRSFGMTALPWPNWVSWILLIAVLLTLYLAWILWRNIAMMRDALANTGLMTGGAPFRSRSELEEAYSRGAVNVEVYDRWKGRLK